VREAFVVVDLGQWPSSSSINGRRRASVHIIAESMVWQRRAVHPSIWFLPFVFPVSVNGHRRHRSINGRETGRN
jgi:hypothetical protein